jgi:hypothetical protein
MRLSNIFELSGMTPSPEMGMNPAPKPGSAPAAAAVSGANAMRGVTGQSGSAVAKALGALGSGKTLTPGLAKALDPYADALTKILSDPQLRSKFVQLMKQAQKEEPAQENVNEDQDSIDAVAGAITRRIMMQHTDLLSKFGPVKVMAAIDDVADFAGSDGLDEIGSSDVSIWTKQVIQDLEAGHFDHMESVDEALNVKQIKKDLDSGMSVDAVIGKHANKNTSNTDEIRKIIKQHAWNNRMKKEDVEEAEVDEVDTVTMDVPLLLRMMEYAREDAHEDMDLHDVAERMIAMSKDGPLSMDDYDSIVGSVEALPAPEEEPVEEGYYAPGPETMPGAVGPQETTTVSFNQSKQMGDATLNINASAKDMEELHRILKLAGIDYDSDGGKQEPSMQDVAVALAPHAPEAPAEEPCGCEDEEPADVKYSTDKQTLINVLRDKLQKRLA